MTSAPADQPDRARPGSPGDTPAADLGVAGPAEETGDPTEAGTPPGYPEEVDPALGPVGGVVGRATGDLRDPGAH